MNVSEALSLTHNLDFFIEQNFWHPLTYHILKLLNIILRLLMNDLSNIKRRRQHAMSLLLIHQLY